MAVIRDRKKQRTAGIIILVFLFTLFLADYAVGEIERINIFQGNQKADYWTLTKGTVQKGWSAEHSEKLNLVDADWSSDITKCFVAEKSGLGAVVTAKDEGTGTLKSEVTLPAGKNMTGTCFISVVTPLADQKIIVANSIAAYAGASKVMVPQTVLAKGQEATIKGTCGSFYWVKLTKVHTFCDDSESFYAFVEKSVFAPTDAGPMLNYSSKKIKKNEQFTLELQMDGNQKYEWVSSNYRVAKVNDKGVVTGLNLGNAQISAITSPGYQKIKSCKVTVVNRNKTKTLRGSKLTKKHQYSFSNSGTSFFGKNQKNTYDMSVADIEKLSNKISDSYGSRISEDNDTIKQYIKSKTNESWRGSCYGMSATVALNRTGQLNVKQKAGYSGKTLNKAKQPKSNAKLKSMINYYQIAQWYTEHDADYYNKQYDTSKTWKKGLKQLVIHTKNKKNAQLFTFHTTSNVHHAILIKKYNGVVKENGKKWYKFSTYDPSVPNGNIYVYVRTNFTASKVKGSSINYGTLYAFSHFTSFGEFNNIKY